MENYITIRQFTKNFRNTNRVEYFVEISNHYEFFSISLSEIGSKSDRYVNSAKKLIEIIMKAYDDFILQEGARAIIDSVYLYHKNIVVDGEVVSYEDIENIVAPYII